MRGRLTAGRSTSVETPRGARSWRSQRLSGIGVVVVNDTAVLYAEVTDEVLGEGDEPEIFRMPMTQVWVRQEGAWRCLAGHAGPRRF
jgi:hypothetical protein